MKHDHSILGMDAAEVLRERAESLAQVSEEEAALDLQAMLLFRLGEEWYAFLIEQVLEIYNEYRIAPIPRVPEFILGVINIRGEIVSVTDIARLMRVSSSESDARGEQSAIVVTNDTCTSAVVVDEIGDIIEVPAGSIEPPLAVVDKSQSEWVSGSVYVEGRLIGIINLDKVLEPIGENE
ncbi:MAG: chemotaxis protein CheW [Coriobacteriia bacterium]